MDEVRLREKVRDAASAYFNDVHRPAREAIFIPGQTPVPVSGRVLDEEDLHCLIDASLDLWLTTGRFASRFCRDFSDYLGVKHTILCNAGSSANLLAISALTSPKLMEKRLRPGDEVITLAAGFPTTVNPIIQNGLVPVFVDVTIPSYNADVSQLEEAISSRTRAVFLPHTLGNPFDVDKVLAFCQRHDLWLIEDSCDALGAVYHLGEIGASNLVGSFGHIATFSFYPAHHITMGEGGAVVTNDGQLKILVESFRDWGRDCWCETGHDDTCRKRFDWQSGDLPYGYDHKYIYSHVGYNLKLTDLQAALGVSQLKKLDHFIEMRRRNFRLIYEGLEYLEEFLILPEITAKSEPSWFGFPIAVRTDAPFTRLDLLRFLDEKKIGVRLLFGGNLTRQPAYQGLTYRKIGDLKNSDFVMNQVFWIGVYPGLTRGMLDYVIEKFRSFTKT